MPYLSKKDIELIAQRIVTAYKKLPVLVGRKFEIIQPKILVEDLLHLSLEVHTLSRTGSILGLTACAEIGVPIYDTPDSPEYFYLDGNTVLIDTSLTSTGANAGRLHFTIVHEACHQIYKMLFPQNYALGTACRKIHYCTSGPDADADYWEEWRTNALASAILMPRDMVLRNMAAFGLGAKIDMLNSVFASNVYDRFSSMAKYMGVSKQALAIRLKQLGLLERDYLQEPYSLMDVYPD